MNQNQVKVIAMKADDKSKSTTKTQPAISTSRRKLVKNAGLAALGLAVAPGLLLSRAARADSRQPGHVPKSAVQYQNKPKGNQKCSNCRFFIPGPKPDAMGHCTIVAGEISPNAWCSAWAAKSS